MGKKFPWKAFWKALMVSSVFKIKYLNKDEDATTGQWSYSYQKIARWYSPAFWMLAAVLFVLSIFADGLIAWGREMIELFKPNKDECCNCQGKTSLKVGSAKYKFYRWMVLYN